LLGDPAALAPQDPEGQRGAAAWYLHGLSSGNFVPALGQFVGSTARLSAPVITKLTETWKVEQRAFSQRDLSGVDYVYLWADGIHVNIRLEEHKLCQGHDGRLHHVLS
jgi:transposase-like protein